MKKHFLKLIITCLIILSCDSNDDSNSSSDNFNRKALLENYTENLIIPSYEKFNSDLVALKTATTNFDNERNSENYNALNQSWINTYLSWQYVEMFNIGLAEEKYYMNKINIYPVDTNIIESNVASENLEVSNNNNFRARGLPALDYLLHGISSNQEAILEIYNSESGQKYLNYFDAIVDYMNQITSEILNDWQLNKNAFINDNGNTANSSLNKLTNDFIYYYEKGLRSNKIGYPAGVFSSNSTHPKDVEAFYNNQISRRLALEAFNACDNFFNGKDYITGEEGPSLKSYIDYLESVGNSNDLSNRINLQFEKSIDKINALNLSFYNQIIEDNNKMLQTFDVIQEGVVMMKVEMLQKLSINVDYVDADGD